MAEADPVLAGTFRPPSIPKGMLHVGVVTPEGAAYVGLARWVVVPAHDGEVAFHPGHAPFVGALGFGELRIVTPEGERRFYLEGGVVQVVDDAVAVLAEDVVPAASVDADAARRDLAHAHEMVPTSDEAFAERDRRERSARARLQVVARSVPAPVTIAH
jgi:F-type H+-transporting ATPase subunit epsilon